MRKLMFVLSFAAVLSSGCDTKKLNDDSWLHIYDADGVEICHGMIELGQKLDDPYTVENMTKAFEAMYPGRSAGVVSTTDLYVRFLPSDQKQFDMLENLGVIMIDHPVDYKIVKEGDYYHDASIPDGKITWQYAVVDKDFNFPSSIRYELLDRCFISEHNFESKADTWIDWDAVEKMSYELTGNRGMYSVPCKDSGFPSGRICVLDEEYDSKPVGVKGVRVSCNVFVKFAHAYTDANGYYRIDKAFRYNPRYRLVFKNEIGFTQGVNLILVPASVSTLGSNPPDGVNCTIDRNADRNLFCRCVVNNAVYEYYMGCSSADEEITLPPTNLRIWNLQGMKSSSAVMLQQGAMVDGSLLQDYLGEYLSIVKMFLPDVTLGLKGKDSYMDIYNVVSHEMAHTSHYMKVGNGYWNKYIDFIIRSFVTSGFITYGAGTEENCGYCAVGEMWAYYMQSRLFKDRYPSVVKSFGTTYWFHPQIFLNLDERGLNRYKLFKALSDDVTDVSILEDKLLYLYPEMKSEIKQSFERYR